ncbi:MAG TPA: hypothetical protein VMD77_05015 [Candidatus Baltobacteraceae bacterium]|nr:hypothetical protein [Candidatus Baltobacteraceae bacterium]
MRSIVLGARSTVIALLVTGLIGLPTMGASPTPLATVVAAQSALLANADAVPGADVYRDDDLVTQAGGSMRLAVGASQVYLLEYSEAVLHQDEGKIQAKMYRGTLGFSTSAPDNLTVDTPFGVVSGADGSRVLGQIALLISAKTSDEKIEVTSYQGTLLVVDKAGVSQRIPEGQTYIGTFASDSGGGSNDAKVQGVGSSGTNWKHVLDLAIPLAIVGGAAIALYVEGSVSCAQPNCHPAQ